MGAADPVGWGPSFMERLSDADRQLLQQSLTHKVYPPGGLVFAEGHASNTLAVVWQGQVAVVKEEDDTFTLLAYRGPGEIVGEMGAMTGRPRSATVIATRETELLVAEGQEFRRLIQEHPSISEAILDVLTARLQAADEARSELSCEDNLLGQRLERAAEEMDAMNQLARLRQEAFDLIVHDMRNPLAVLQTSLQMLRIALGVKLSGDMEDYLSLAQNSTSKVLGMVETLLESARQEAAGVDLTLEPFNLEELLRSEIHKAQPAARELNQKLEIKIKTSLPPLSADKALLQRVVTNLLDNAIAYTPRDGHITIEVKASNDEMRVSVVDTGPGVPRAYREKIFQRFVKVPEIKGHRRGFGLGLYFCQRVIKAHGGRIWVEDGYDGVGSRFTFALPLSREKENT